MIKKSTPSGKNREIAVVLDNLRSMYNVGSIFRTADAFGVHTVHLCGTTPAPVDRFGRKVGGIAKVALGGEESVSWEYWKGTKECVEELQKHGWQVVAVEQTERSVPLGEFEAKEKTAYIFGAEVEGVTEELLEICDEIVEIPMRGAKESLNVSVTAGIVLHTVSQ